MLPDPGLPVNADDAVLSELVAPHNPVDDDNDDNEVVLLSARPCQLALHEVYRKTTEMSLLAQFCLYQKC